MNIPPGFDVNGVQIQVGDTVEAVGLSVGFASAKKRIQVVQVETSNIFPQKTFIYDGCHGYHGTFRIVSATTGQERSTVCNPPQKPRSFTQNLIDARIAQREHEERIARDLSHDRPSVNPKDAVGSCKAGVGAVPACVVNEMGVGMGEGGFKYGRHNYRETRVRAEVYFEAARRHIDDWWEGEDIDPDSGLSHVTKALCTLAVLRDAMINDMLEDDRPPAVKPGLRKALNEKAATLRKAFPSPKPAHTEKARKLRESISSPKPLTGQELYEKAREVSGGDLSPFMPWSRLLDRTRDRWTKTAMKLAAK
jgi:hypothetical protein